MNDLELSHKRWRNARKEGRGGAGGKGEMGKDERSRKDDIIGRGGEERRDDGACVNN